MTSFQPWGEAPSSSSLVIPAPLPHSLLERGPATGSCFPRPMKSPLFCMSHPAGRAVTSAPHSPSGCPWHSGVCDKGQAGAAGGARPSPAQHGCMERSAVRDASREQLQKLCFSCLPAGKPSPRIPGWCWSPAGCHYLCQPRRDTAHAANTFFFDGVGFIWARIKRARPVFKSALRPQ